jgi:hypothetical protein
MLSFAVFLTARAVQIPQTAKGGHEILPDGTAQLSRIRLLDFKAAKLGYVFGFF